ncbi:MAG: Hsp70 family protein [Anaerolineae bacterium]
MGLLPELVQREFARANLPIRHTRWYLGIDLATTNSTAVVVDAEALLRGDREQAVQLVPVAQETKFGVETSPLLPSFVAEVAPGDWRVGLWAKEALRDGLVRGRRIFYSTKSEMGLGREPYYPFSASKDLDCPYKVAGRVLAAIREAVVARYGSAALNNLVVTVPASFQLAARKDALRAAELAGLQLADGCLFDEPNAALLDYLFSVAGEGGADDSLAFDRPRAVLVFDFGGGTCDISIVRVHLDASQGRLALSNLAISRYEQLGGDNIDTAIAEQVLLPALLERNGLDPLDITYTEKRSYVMPVLVDVAEALKLGLCAEYSNQLGLHSRNAIRREQIYATQPSVSVVAPVRARGDKTEKRELLLADPTLTLDEFDSVLAAFLDPDKLYATTTTFNTSTSIFTPVVDALDRAGLEPHEIDAVLLAGGSSLIPQVQHALQEYFPNAALLRFHSAEQTQFAIARGAALQSLFMHGLGRSLIMPIAQESIGVLTYGLGFQPLIQAGTELPYPIDGNTFATYEGLAVPEDGMHELQIVLAADSPDKPLGVEKLRFASPPKKGERVTLRWRLDANKVLSVQAFLSEAPDVQCELSLQNPLCATGFRDEDHRQILELEQQIAVAVSNNLAPVETWKVRRELGWLYLRLERFERALDWARSALQAVGRADSSSLHLMGRAYEGLNRLDLAEARYAEALAADPRDDSAMFSLSLCLQRQRRCEEALDVIDRAISIDPREGAYLAARADVLRTLGRHDEAEEALQQAADLLMATDLRYSYQRWWLRFVADELRDGALRKAAQEAELRSRYLSVRHDPEKLPRKASGTSGV